MEERRMTEQESMLIIQQMIHTAKNEQKDNGKGWILWGWLLLAASILTFFNIQFRWFSTFFFWNAFGGIALLFFIYTVMRFFFGKGQEPVRTYTGDLFERLNIGFFIFLAFIIVSINMGVGPEKGFSILIGLYGFWVLIYGTALNFKPSIIGAYITWAIAFVSLFIREFQWIMLLHGVAVLCGYIIPGHLANVEFNKIQKETSLKSV
ncbi:hypothetical protein [Flavisolibacter tropicus]|uniref:Uncharacterized protein n=1 Tax=Flavisolibacter tropicus TaxID=1492898 RepID=A0A172TZ50_9BACT|nr:hypothetical protein [Flavisolibacter tropicus]ANE52276.1 hypothetical protein SY85_19090 [Flavisolibacter tropicus]